MVDRELLMICPDGEDHRGHEKGDTTEEVGSGRKRWHAWRRSRRTRTSMDGNWCEMAVRRTCGNWNTEDEDRAGGRIMRI